MEFCYTISESYLAPLITETQFNDDNPISSKNWVLQADILPTTTTEVTQSLNTLINYDDRDPSIAPVAIDVSMIPTNSKNEKGVHIGLIKMKAGLSTPRYHSS